MCERFNENPYSYRTKLINRSIENSVGRSDDSSSANGLIGTSSVGSHLVCEFRTAFRICRKAQRKLDLPDAFGPYIAATLKGRVCTLGNSITAEESSVREPAII